VSDLEEPTPKNTYKTDSFKKISLILFMAAMLCLLVIFTSFIGTDVSFTRSYEVIIDHICGITYAPGSPDWWADYYIWNNVLPGVAMCVIAGAGLAIGGCVMQSMMGNPLADPYTTGISSGACLGAVTAIIMGFTFSTVAGEYGIITNAFVCALIPAIIIVLFSKYINNSPATMILLGTAISYFFNALVTFIMIGTDSDTLQSAFLWQVGSVTNASWSDIPIMLTIVVISSFAVGLASRKFNILALGDDSAKSLGLDVENFRILCLILLSVLIASIVSYTGIIGFVGLTSPHIARFLIGGNNRFVVPASMAIGALMLTSANVIARMLTSTADIPIGVIMAFIGSPIFLYLVIRKKSDREVI
jgi:iron complex transport system permease protein